MVEPVFILPGKQWLPCESRLDLSIAHDCSVSEADARTSVLSLAFAGLADHASAFSEGHAADSIAMPVQGLLSRCE